MIDDEFLRILRCPVTRQPLQVADDAILARINAAIGAGRLLNRLGQTVTQALDGGLINQTQTLLYPIHDEIPCLLADEAIDLAPLAAGSGEHCPPSIDSIEKGGPG